MIRKSSNGKRILAVFLLLFMVISMLAGCGGSPSLNTADGENASGKKKEEQEKNSQTGDTRDTSEEQAKDKAMGRYMETTSDLSDYCSAPKELKRLSDGTLVISDAFYQQVFSRDNGESWDMESAQWFKDLRSEASYIQKISYGADGTIGIIYTVKNETREEGGEDDDSEILDEDFYARYRYLIVRPDGTQIPVQISPTGDERGVNGLWISDTGRVFVTTYGENIYEVNEEGSCEKFLTVDRSPDLINFQGNIMIMDGSKYEKLLLYDMEKKEMIEDEVLQDFIEENYGDRSFSQQDCYDMYFFPGEEGVIYLAGNKGLHRHVIGGGAIEQVIDGSLSSLSNPSLGLMGMIALPDNEFMALSYGNKITRFTYNPDIPTVPDETISVYSLKENDTVRQAVSIYQSGNPAIYVKYESGMGADDSVTRDDALKKLNTQIMAGEGPDVLILDNMPLDSYIEKNLLMDLSECIGSLDEELFGNIVDAFKTDGKVYAIPCEFQLPIIAGKEEYISRMQDLEGIADTIEVLRADNPAKPVLEICSERGIMRFLAMVSAPAWKTDKGELDKEALKEFLIQSKRVYDAQMDGLPGDYIENYMNMNVSHSSFYGGPRESSDYFRVADEIGYLMEDEKIVMGTVYYPHGVCEIFSIKKVEGYEEDIVKPMNGQCRNVFIPKTLIGISAASQNTDRAMEMVKVLLGSENQDYLFSGLPVNKTAFEKEFERDESKIAEDGIFSSLGLSTGDGRSFSFNVYWIEEDQKQDLMKWVEAVDTPYIEDTVLEEVIYTYGAGYMRGNQSVEESVDSIDQELAIYMSE